MQPDDVLVLSGGTLIDVRTGQCTPDAVIVIEHGRIMRVGQGSEVQLPSVARIEDVSGAWMVPGLMDMHVHLTSDPMATQLLPLYLACGVTTVRDVGGLITELVLLRDALRAGERLGPRLFLAGPLLDGLPPLWPSITILVNTAMRARSAVRMLVDQGVDFIKIYNNVPQDSLEAIVAEAHTAGKTVAGHIPRTLSMTRAVEIGMDCLEHIRVTGRELLPLDEANRIDFLPLGTRETLLWERFDLGSAGMHRLIENLVQAHVFLDPTLIVDAAMFDRAPEDAAATAMTEALPEECRRALQRPDWMDALEGPAELREAAHAGFEKRLEFISMCNEAGVRFLAGTDTFGPGTLLPGASLLNELELLCRAGLSPLEALRSATDTAASALGCEGDLGILATGGLADVVVLDANPLENISNARSVRLVVQGGQVLTPAKVVASLSSS
jgi:imidazolonepropionase-like amidohydrolase